MKIIAFRFCVVVVATLSAMTTLGTGVSSAKDPYVGQTYAYAAGKISDRGGNPVIMTVVGSQLATNDCIVTSWRKSSYAKKDHFDHEKKVLLSLNCASKLAHGGAPGNSLASPEGRAEKAIEEKAERINNKPAICMKDLDSCQRFCDKYAGLCSREILSLL